MSRQTEHINHASRAFNEITHLWMFVTLWVPSIENVDVCKSSCYWQATLFPLLQIYSFVESLWKSVYHPVQMFRCRFWLPWPNPEHGSIRHARCMVCAFLTLRFPYKCAIVMSLSQINLGVGRNNSWFRYDLTHPYTNVLIKVANFYMCNLTL